MYSILLQKFEMEDFYINKDKNRLSNISQIPNLSPFKRYVYQNIIHRNINIKSYKYNFRHLKTTSNNYGVITIPQLF